MAWSTVGACRLVALVAFASGVFPDEAEARPRRGAKKAAPGDAEAKADEKPAGKRAKAKRGKGDKRAKAAAAKRRRRKARQARAEALAARATETAPSPTLPEPPASPPAPAAAPSPAPGPTFAPDGLVASFLATVPIAATEPNRGGLTRDFIGLQIDGAQLYRRRTVAKRRTGPISIDGVEDEAAWQAVPATRADWKQRPDEGGRVTGATDFRVLYDDDALYVTAHAHDPEPERVQGILFRPVDWTRVPKSDWVAVMVDPTNNRRTGFGFMVNPAGVKFDYSLVEDSLLDETWDGVWEAAIRRGPTGWHAEFRIPFSQLRMNGGEQESWGFQVNRRFQRTQEYDFWSPTPFAARRWASLFGDLEIRDRLDVGLSLELLPYLLGGARLESVPGDDRLNDSVGPRYGLGGDFKLQVTDSLKLTGAINPDFGQVEQDPSVVNLTAFETYFPERRPLFIKDAELYTFALGRADENLFYSRRIGAPPSLTQAGPGVLHVDEPDATTIYGAGKLSGQLPGGVTVGLLSAVTQQERSRAQLESGEITGAVIQPTTIYDVAQLGRTFRDGGSDLRLQLTSVKRLLEGTEVRELHEDAWAGGVQALHRFGEEKRWALYGMAGGSWVHGKPEALQLTQRSSRRYYQRPDAGHVDYDPNRTTLSGYAFNLQGRHISDVRATVGIDGRSPGFEVNDAGYQLEADLLNPWVTVGYDKFVATPSFKRVIGNVTVESAADWAPDVLRHGVKLDGVATLASDDETGGSLGYTHGVLDTKLLRGGPAMAGLDELQMQLYFQTATKRDLFVRVQATGAARPEAASWRAGGAVTAAWNLLSNLEVSVTPSFVRNIDDTQYVDTSIDLMGEPRYVIGRVRQSTLAVSANLDLTITPRMSLQVFLQPFLSAGRFSDFKEATAFRAARYDDRFASLGGRVSEAMGVHSVDADGDGVTDYGFDRPDFQVAELLSNVVYRWEYRPGSTVYLVWSQSRAGFSPDGNLTTGDLGDVVKSHAVHAVVLKASYWWSP
jgi:hypothetical protein